jgi:hypothetical protein
VEFLFDGQTSLEDVIKLVSPDNAVLLEIPIELRLPAPQLVFPARLDFGSLLHDGRQHTRTLELRNEGNAPCEVELLVSERSPFRVRHGRATLGCTPDSNKCAVKLDFVAADLGAVASDARVLVDGMHYGVVTLAVCVQDQQLQLLAPDAVSEINNIDIGCVHYNTSRTLTAVLFNNSPDVCTFVIEQEQQSVWAHVGGGRTADDAFTTSAFSCSSSEGVLQPREKRVVEFTFYPVHPLTVTGFKAQVRLRTCLARVIKLPVQRGCKGHRCLVNAVVFFVDLSWLTDPVYCSPTSRL